MKVVALTGRSGCGKSTVAAFFRAQGLRVIDADLIARQIVEPGSPTLEALAQAFGADILDEDGPLPRRELAARAFSAPGGAEKLTRITHPAIIAELNRLLDEARAAGEAFALVDGAVIIGAPFERFCDEFIVVTAPEEEAAARIAARDGIPPEQARARLASQTPEAALCAHADYIIHNDGTPELLLRRAREVLSSLMGET